MSDVRCTCEGWYVERVGCECQRPNVETNASNRSQIQTGDETVSPLKTLAEMDNESEIFASLTAREKEVYFTGKRMAHATLKDRIRELEAEAERQLEMLDWYSEQARSGSCAMYLERISDLETELEKYSDELETHFALNKKYAAKIEELEAEINRLRAELVGHIATNAKTHEKLRSALEKITRAVGTSTEAHKIAREALRD